MQVRIRAFAGFREILGRDGLDLDLPDGATARSAFETLFASRPDYPRLLKSTMFAVNREYVSADHRLAAGDELAFIPPVAGGAGGEHGVGPRREAEGRPSVTTGGRR